MARNLVTARGRAFILEGVPELKARIERLRPNTPQRQAELKKIYMSAAMWLRNEARSLAPIGKKPKPGPRLRDAIFAAYGDPSKQSVLVGVNLRMAPHGHWEEFGTSHAPAHPYMRPAMTATRSIVVRVISEGFSKMLEDALR